MSPDGGYWKGRRVLLTGHTGFKGSWATLLLHRLGAVVTGLSLPGPVSTPSLFDAARLAEFCEDRRGDVRDPQAVTAALASSAAEVLIHMAAQPIVRLSVFEPLETFDVNVMGTACVLQTARAAEGLQTVVIVTSDKCYENRERVWPYREDEPMGGSDPYSASKGCAELVTAAFAKTYFRSGARVVSVRAGNVVGGGDWASDRLLPDLVRTALSGAALDIRSPSAVRPWQHVLDPVRGYLAAAEHAGAGRGATPIDSWNFGPDPGEELTVREVVELFRSSWEGAVDVRYPQSGPDAVSLKQEAGILRVDNTKAKVELGWRPAMSDREAVTATATWNRAFATGADARRLALREVDEVLNR